MGRRSTFARGLGFVVLSGVILHPDILVSQEPVTPPVAPMRPRYQILHDEKRTDNYFWLREKSNPEVIKYLEAENAYTAARMRHTEALQETLYKELLGRIKETDTAVPYRSDGYWYYTRTEQGQGLPDLLPEEGHARRAGGGHPRPERAGPRQEVSRAGRHGREPGRHDAALPRGPHRVPRVHALREGPDDRADPRIDPERLERHRVGQRQHDVLLHDAPTRPSAATRSGGTSSAAPATRTSRCFRKTTSSTTSACSGRAAASTSSSPPTASPRRNGDSCRRPRRRRSRAVIAPRRPQRRVQRRSRRRPVLHLHQRQREELPDRHARPSTTRHRELEGLACRIATTCSSRASTSSSSSPSSPSGATGCAGCGSSIWRRTRATTSRCRRRPTRVFPATNEEFVDRARTASTTRRRSRRRRCSTTDVATRARVLKKRQEIPSGFDADAATKCAVAWRPPATARWCRCRSSCKRGIVARRLESAAAVRVRLLRRDHRARIQLQRLQPRRPRLRLRHRAHPRRPGDGPRVVRRRQDAAAR